MIIESFKYLINEKNIHLYAFVFMSNHIHFIGVVREEFIMCLSGRSKDATRRKVLTKSQFASKFFVIPNFLFLIIKEITSDKKFAKPRTFLQIDFCNGLNVSVWSVKRRDQKEYQSDEKMSYFGL
jgi:REP element-mobilizing transposase RayT